MAGSRRGQSILDRQAKLNDLLKAEGLAGLALNPGPSLTYLTGLHFHLMERPVVVIFRPEAAPVIVLPALEAPKLQPRDYDVRPYLYTEDPDTWQGVFTRALTENGLSQGQIGLEPRRIRYLELDYLQKAAPGAALKPAARIIKALRVVKDETEIQAMLKAVQIAQDALRQALTHVKIGVQEREMASELVLQLLRHGSEPALPFFPIVGFGPNSANPHAQPTGRALAPGDLALFDWGATAGGYVSDITRVFVAGTPDPELALVGEIVAEANAAARAAAGPGVPAAEVDDAARQVINQAGYGAQFTHRTGHGLGLEGHEEPYIRAGNLERLEPGMTFTIEPGIYLAGRGGVRIEDNVAITTEGAFSLTDMPRTLEPLNI